MPYFTDIARPLTSITKMDITFNWTKQCKKAFQFIKESLMKEPILKYSDPKNLYVLFTDASKYAWASMLKMSDEHEVDGK